MNSSHTTEHAPRQKLQQQQNFVLDKIKETKDKKTKKEKKKEKREKKKKPTCRPPHLATCWQLCWHLCGCLTFPIDDWCSRQHWCRSCR
jgi:hypothetical protein